MRNLHTRLEVRDPLEEFDSSSSRDRLACFNVRWSTDGAFLAAAMGIGQCNILRRDGRTHFVTPRDADSGVLNVRWGTSLDTRSTFMFSTATKVEHWNVHEKKRLSQVHEHKNQIFALDMSLDGLTFATGGLDRTVRIYDLMTSSLVCKLEHNENTNGHQNRIYGIKYLNDEPNLLVSGGWDKMVYVWDMRTQLSAKRWSGCYVTGDSIDYRSGVVLLGNAMPTEDEMPIQLWELRTGTLLHGIGWSLYPTQTKEQSKVSSVCFASRHSGETAYIFAASHEKNELRGFDSGYHSKDPSLVAAANTETANGSMAETAPVKSKDSSNKSEKERKNSVTSAAVPFELLCRFTLPKSSQHVFSVAASPVNDEICVAASDGGLYFVPFDPSAVPPPSSSGFGGGGAVQMRGGEAMTPSDADGDDQSPAA